VPDLVVTQTTSGAHDGLASVQEAVLRACRDAGRQPSSVTLIAVSKTFGAEAIAPVIAAGQRAFGENRVQEAKAKWTELLRKYGELSPPERARVGEGVDSGPPPVAFRAPTFPLQGQVKSKIELHLIGPLQSNKTKDAVALFDAIHSVDRVSLCASLAKEIEKQGRAPTLFVQVNTGAEPQKAGVLPQDADAFLAQCRKEFGLTIGGLMCIPPADQAAAPHFALTAKIAARNGLKLLSMGMSADYETAIHLGATHVRVGSAIFGGRG
jgi:uncharacterized pyridoxal phosphate-containing UPF0001 family protein